MAAEPQPNNSAQEILTALLDLPAAERQDAARGLCRGDSALEREVHLLLDLLPEAESYFERFACPSILGRRVGSYRIVAEIGSGGMGSVYRAERADGEFSRAVAVKLLSLFSAGGEAWRRFQSEKRILAGLEHPNIAHLVDAGCTEDGIPYLVMELVDGVPIDRYCQEGQLDVAARLRLFQQICQAAHFAHQHLVVHRDIKPANILVTSDGIPKLLDFGISKSLALESADAGATRPEARLMTLRYASPEQVRGEPVGTSSDVYSLGLVLYELLGGSPAYGLEARPLAEVLRALSELDPAPPSRAAGSPKLARALAGDLDNIVMKAIRKTPSERYASAHELAADLGNYLAGRPVSAVAPTQWYRLRKWMKRHPIALPVTLAAALIVLAAIVTVAWQARVAERERRQADRQRRIAETESAAAQRRFEEVRRLARSVVFDYHPQMADHSIPTALRARMLADSLQYLDRLAQDRRSDPQLVIEVARGYLRMASVQAGPRWANMGDRAGALASVGKARTLLEELLRQVPGHASARLWLALVSCQRGQFEDAEAAVHVRDCLSRLQELAPLFSDSIDRFEGLARAYSRQADLAEDPRRAVELRNKAIACFESVGRLDGSNLDWQRDLASEFRYLALDHAHAGELELMGRRVRAALELDHQRLKAQPDSSMIKFVVSFDLGLLAEHADRRGALAEALGYYRRTLALRRQVLGSDPGNALVQHRYFNAFNEIARVKRKMGDRAGARLAYRQAIDALGRLSAAGSDGNWHVAMGRVYAGYGLLLVESSEERSEGCVWLNRALGEWKGASFQHGSLFRLRDGERQAVEHALAERCAAPRRATQ